MSATYTAHVYCISKNVEESDADLALSDSSFGYLKTPYRPLMPIKGTCLKLQHNEEDGECEFISHSVCPKYTQRDWLLTYFTKQALCHSEPAENQSCSPFPSSDHSIKVAHCTSEKEKPDKLFQLSTRCDHSLKSFTIICRELIQGVHMQE